MKIALSVLLCAICFGCAAPSNMPAPNQQVQVKCVLPVITALPETKELQKKSGINISLALENCECVESVAETAVEIQPTIAEILELSLKGVNSYDRPNYMLVEITQTPVFKIKPEKLAFRVKINNQMQRVFRGDGTVLLYNFGGKNTSVSKEDYQEFTNLIVPPRTEADIKIYGPAFKNIPEKTTLGIFLYDVVTKTDGAGNIIEKQNFEWYYDYSTQISKEISGEVVKTKKWVRR